MMVTAAQDTLDCSPRGDRAGQAFRVLDERTIAIPDRRGNNRIETLRNLVRDPRIGLLFMIPGIESALRVKGMASISINKKLLDSFVTDEEPTPGTVVLVSVLSAYVQNARAIRHAALWDNSTWHTNDQVPDASALSTHGIIHPDNAPGATSDAMHPATDIDSDELSQ